MENRIFLRLAIALLVIAVAAGAAYLFLAGPAGRVLDLGTLRRYRYTSGFYRAFKPDAHKQLVVALGDSVTMSGFNGYTFEQVAGPGWEAYNLATPAKTFPEYLFDLAEPALTDAHLVIFVTPAALYDPQYTEIDPRKAELSRVLGARVDQPAWRAYAEAIPAGAIDAALAPRWQDVLDSRWRVEESLLWEARLLNPGERRSQTVRNLMDGFSTDLKYPRWDGRADAQELAAEMQVIRRGFPRLDTSNMAPDQNCVAAFGFVVEQALVSCRDVTLVAAPVHGDVRRLMGEARFHEFRETVKTQQRDRVRVIDLSEFLADGEFRDYVHLSNEASEKVTRRIAQAMLTRESTTD